MSRTSTISMLCASIVVMAAAIAPGSFGAGSAAGNAVQATPAATASSCPVTLSNGDLPPEWGNPDYGGGYGNDALWTNIWMWGKYTVPVPPSHVLPDGSLGEMKWAWYRYVPGELTIEGRRLDAPAPPLHAIVLDGYGSIGFQVSGIIFPTGGCWEITGRVGDASLTFVTIVIPPEDWAAPATTPNP